MRTFEERKEEIFRRSEKRVTQRTKTVRRVILTCIPVVLCVTALTGYVMFGGFFRLDNAAQESVINQNGMGLHYGMSLEDAEGNLECAPELQSLQISDGAQIRTSTDPALLQLFADVAAEPLYSAEESLTPESIGEWDGKTGAEWVTGDDIIEGDPYPLALTYTDGTQVWFTLRGNRLTREDGEIYMLTEEMAAALYALLEETP